MKSLAALLTVLPALTSWAQTAAVTSDPSFTQDRQFTNARNWMLDPGSITVEQWWIGSFGVPGALAGSAYQNDQLLQTDVEIGLMPHLELDIFAVADLNQNATGDYQLNPTGLTGFGAEVRVALGRSWGQIWGNPTLDALLWGRIDEPTRLEGRVLLGGQIFTPRLLGVANLTFARNSFHDDATGIDYQIEAQLGLNCELVRDILRVGAETTLGWDSHNQVDSQNDTILFPAALLGPVVLLTEPHKRIKLLASLLFGLEPWDPPWQSQLVVSTTF